MVAESNVRTQVAPANPAQVTELIGEAKDFAERMTGQPWACELVERLIDALTAAIGAGGQAVKPLEWQPENDEFYSETILGWYSVMPSNDGSWFWKLDDNGSEDMPSAIAAQAAAQADYERRILSALSQPHPADERVVEALRFYASPGTWEDDRAPDPAGTPIPGTMPADLDRGDIARAALSTKEGR